MTAPARYDRDRGRKEIEDIKRLADQQCFTLLRKLRITDQPKGTSGYIAINDPMSKDSRASLVIWTRKPGGLSWKRYGSMAQGDWIALVAYLNGWYHERDKGFQPALRWLKDALGYETLSPQQKAADLARARKAEAEARKASAEDEARQRRDARTRWLEAMPLGRGAIADRYLAGRGIDLQALPKGPRGGERLPHVLRGLAAARHAWEDKRDPRHGRISQHPCLIAACVDYRPGSDHFGHIRAVHRTWLKADGSGKADVVPQRKVWPGFAGLVIPLWRGDSGLSIEQACAAGLCETLIVCEGIETALSAAIAAPQFRVWAAIAIDNIGNVPLPDCIDGVIVHRENDWTKIDAVQAYERSLKKLKAKGRPVAEARATVGSDFNDVLRQRGLSDIAVALADAERQLRR